MSTAILPIMPLPTARPAPVSTVFLPKEHGSWSLALEPLALGLLITPSWAGGALAGAALAGFFARRPLKAALDSTPSARRTQARLALALLVGLALVGLDEAVVLAPWSAFWPLLPVAALGAVFAWFDAQGESRAAAAEIAGSAAFAFLPAAFATLEGASPIAALVLTFLALARSLPAVLVVRSFLRAAKGGAARPALPLAAAVLAFALTLALTSTGKVPAVVVLPAAGLFARTLWLLGPWRPAWPARRIGMLEAILGLLYVGLIAAAYRA